MATVTDERAFLEPKEDNDTKLEETSVIGEVEDKETEEKNDDLFVEDHDAGLEDKKDEDEDEEDKEVKDKKDEEEDDNEENEEPIPQTLYQTLKARDAKLLKEVPELRTTIFREQKFSEIFPTIEEAEEAREAVEVFAQYQQDLTSGNSQSLLETLNKTDKKGYESFVTGFLPTLEEVDEKLFKQIVFPQFKRLFKIAVQSGREEYAIAARNLNHMIWNNVDVDKDEGLVAPTKKNDPKEDELTERERKFEERLYTTFAKDLDGQVTRKLETSINVVFKNSNISPLIQKSLTKEIFDKIGTALSNDKRWVSEKEMLWRRARREGYSEESKDRIKNAYLSRAALLVPKIRQQVLTEAKISVKTVNKENKQEPVRPSVGANVPGKSGKIDPKTVDWNKTKEEDFIRGKNIHLKGR